jgi:hypothetical protein
MWIKCKKTSVDETECNFLLFQKTGCDYNCVWCPEDDCYDDYGQDGEINETTSEYRAYTTCEIISIMPACINNVYYNGDLGKYYIANLVYDTIVRELGDWVIQQLECKNVSEEFAKKHEQ